MQSQGMKVACAALVFGMLGFGVPAAQAQWACTAFEHANFKGKSFGVAVNGSVNNSKLNNNISSFKMVRGCQVIAYTETNFRGPSARWTKDVAFVGPRWNDVISSYQCVCR
jgi:hypothetical protein